MNSLHDKPNKPITNIFRIKLPYRIDYCVYLENINYAILTHTPFSVLSKRIKISLKPQDSIFFDSWNMKLNLKLGEKGNEKIQ